MNSRQTILCSLLASAVAAFPLVFRFDFNRSDLRVLDVLLMLPSTAWIYLILLVSLAVYILRMRLTRGSVVFPMFIISIFYGLVTISQFPALSDKDYYLHGRVAQAILTSQHIPMGTEATSYAQYPGAFLLWSIFTLETGMSIIQSAQVLTIMFQLFFVFSFYLMTRKYLRNDAYLAPTLFVLSSVFFTRDKLDHFCPQLFALPMFFLVFYVFSGGSKVKRTGLLLLITFTASIIISHPLTSLLLMTSYLIMVLLSITNGNETSARGICLFALVALFAWNVFFAASFFETGVIWTTRSVLDFDFLRRYSETVVNPLPEDVNRLMLVRTLNVYWIALDLIVIVGAIYVAYRELAKKKTSIFSSVFLGSALNAFLISLSLFWISRMLFFVLIPACCLSCRLFDEVRARVKLTNKISLRVRKNIFSILFVSLVILSFLAAYSRTSEYLYYVYTWETYPSIFLFRHNLNKNLIVASDFTTKIIHSFYDPEVPYLSGIVDFSSMNHSSVQCESSLFGKDFLIRSFRQVLGSIHSGQTLEEALETSRCVDSLLVRSTMYNRIFDNKFVQIYAKK